MRNLETEYRDALMEDSLGKRACWERIESLADGVCVHT